MTADGRITSSVFRAMLSAETQPNAAKLIGQPLQTPNKTDCENNQRNILELTNQSPDFNQNAVLPLTEDKTEGTKINNQAATEREN